MKGMLHMRYHSSWLWFAVVCCFSMLGYAQNTLDQEITSYTNSLPFTMPKIQLPVIPNASVNICTFGAVADGVTLNTKPINDAIHTCAQKGGGTVIVPAGTWLTGPVQLESNINLHLETGAMLLFTGAIDEYPLFTRSKGSTYRRVPMISGSNLDNVAITGSGVVNGNGQYWRMVKKEKLTLRQWKDLIASGGVVSADGKMWWPSKEAMNGEQYLKNLKKQNKMPSQEDIKHTREYSRPVMVELSNCKHLLLDGVTFTNPPAWTVSPIQCEDVVMRNIKIENEWWWQNSDGLDISACHNVLVYNSMVNAGDDAICLKPGTPSKAYKNGFSCENIVVADCTVFHGHGGFTIGSESYGGARNVFVKNLTCIGTDVGLRFKSVKGRGGIIENIYVDGVQMKDIANEAILFDMTYDGDATVDISNKSRIPKFHGFDLQHIVCDGASNAMVIRGEPDVPVKEIKLHDASFITTRSFSLRYADGIDITNVTLKYRTGSLLVVKNAQNISLKQISPVLAVDVFAHVEGAQSKNIQLDKKDVTQAKHDVEFGDDEAPRDAVIIK
jgi:DNA sulfur modification protein DndE